MASALLACCKQAKRLCDEDPGNRALARAFFEANFIPHRVVHSGESPGLFTGYYEPELAGSRTRTNAFPVPLLRRPPDLVTIVDDALRASEGISLTHGRRSADGAVEAYFTREEIECGALDEATLAFAYVADPVDAYFLHIQGSGLIAFEDGARVRITYDGKNGHPYTSVGQYVIGLGEVSNADMTLDALKAWLRVEPERGRRAMWVNRSYIFFKELGDAARSCTLGTRNIPLTPGRSLAVDASRHALGLPIFVDVPGLVHTGMPGGFRRLMVANDVGSAIQGAERADIFYGSGPDAGRLAGTTKHRGTFRVLLPRLDGQAAGQ